MGYTSGWSSLPELIECRTRDASYASKSGFTIKHHTIAHKYVPIKGDTEFKGALWYVVERTGITPDGKSGVERFIALDLIGCEVDPYGRGRAWWGYKDLSESSGPYEVSCPLSFLRLVPPDKGPFVGNWRERVVAYHAERKARLFKIGVGDRVKLVEGVTVRGVVVSEATITHTKPLMGTVEIEGSLVNVSIKRRHLVAKLPRVNATV